MKPLPNINYVNNQIKESERQMNTALETYHLFQDQTKKKPLEEIITKAFNKLEEFRKLKLEIEKQERKKHA